MLCVIPQFHPSHDIYGHLLNSRKAEPAAKTDEVVCGGTMLAKHIPSIMQGST